MNLKLINRAINADFDDPAYLEFEQDRRDLVHVGIQEALDDLAIAYDDVKIEAISRTHRNQTLTPFSGSGTMIIA